MSVFGKGKKSDDTILEEAEAARTRERQGKVAADDQFEHTFEEVKDNAVKAKMAGASEEKVAHLEKQLEEMRKMMSEVMKGQVRPATSAQMETLSREKLKKSDIPQCSICGQYVTVCGGTPDGHTTVRVLPDRPEHQDNFPGVIWNGQVYCGSAVVVPKSCAEDIKAAVKVYTEYRFNLNQNRGKNLGLKGRRFVAESISRDGMPII